MEKIVLIATQEYIGYEGFWATFEVAQDTPALRQRLEAAYATELRDPQGPWAWEGQMDLEWRPAAAEFPEYPQETYPGLAGWDKAAFRLPYAGIAGVWKVNAGQTS